VQNSKSAFTEGSLVLRISASKEHWKIMMVVVALARSLLKRTRCNMMRKRCNKEENSKPRIRDFSARGIGLTETKGPDQDLARIRRQNKSTRPRIRPATVCTNMLAKHGIYSAGLWNTASLAKTGSVAAGGGEFLGFDRGNRRHVENAPRGSRGGENMRRTRRGPIFFQDRSNRKSIGRALII